MPTANDDSRDLMEKWFHDPIDMKGPYAFLMAHGYTEKAGIFLKPTSNHTVSKYEWECLCFLFEEWDFGFEREIKYE